MKEIQEKFIECLIFEKELRQLYPGMQIIDYYEFISAYRVKMPVFYTKYFKSCEKVYFERSSQVKFLMNNVRDFINIQKFYDQNIYGKNVGVAVIDTGVDSILDLCIPKNRIIKFIDFVSKSQTPYDDNGHGTFVSGVIAGNGIMSASKYSGIAPMSNIVAIKALDNKGEASSFTILKAMQWIIDNKAKYNIKVVCMSFGSEPLKNKDSLSYGSSKLWQAGLVVVTAGGNNGPNFDTITSPGINPHIITVGALDYLSDGLKVANYSSRGSLKNTTIKPDILAPGTKIISTNRNMSKSAYIEMSGTSVSTPIIAGVCVLLCEKYPKNSPDQIKSILLKNTRELGVSKQIQGKGFFVYK